MSRSSLWDDRTKSLVWCLDDESHIRRLVDVNLQRAGYEARTFATIRELYEALDDPSQPKPDLLILELGVREVGRDGWAVLKRFTSEPDLAQRCGTMSLTRLMQDADIFRGWQYPINCYLTKPFNPMELLKFAKSVIGEKLG